MPIGNPAGLGCTTFQYKKPNYNTDEYPSGYNKYISKAQLSHLYILVGFYDLRLDHSCNSAYNVCSSYQFESGYCIPSQTLYFNDL